MSNYSQTMQEILQDAFEGARLITKDGEDGFEYEIGCDGCPMHAGFSWGVDRCSLFAELDDNIRKVDNGSCNGGKCFNFYSLDQFWDDFSNDFAIDPETGEVLGI